MPSISRSGSLSLLAAALVLGAPLLTKAAPPDGPAVEKCIAEAERVDSKSFKKRLHECYGQADTLYRRPDTLRTAAYFMRTVTRKWAAPQRDLMAQAYARYLEPYMVDARVKTTDSNTLYSLFDALDSLAFYTRDRTHVLDLKKVYEELISRNGPNYELIRPYYDKLVAARLFDEARKLLKKFPPPWVDQGLPVIETPSEPLAGRPALYKLSQDGKGLRLVPVDLASGPRIVIVTHPGCHFSQSAFAAISADPKLKRVFEDHALLVGPQKPFYLEGMKKWNSKYPTIQQTAVHLEKDWPEGMDWTGTPYFHYFLDGKVLHAEFGWESEKGLQTIREGLVKIGLIRK